MKVSSMHRFCRRLPALLLLALSCSAFLFPIPSRIPTSSAQVLHATKKSKQTSSELGNTVPPPPPPASTPPPLATSTDETSFEEEEMEAEEENAAVTGLSPTMYDKLRSEATAPFRSLRLFIYGGIGVGASLGGYTAVTQLVQSLQHRPDALPLSQSILNVGVDFGVAAAAAGAWVFENRLKQVTDKEMQALRAKEPFRLTFDMKKARERALSGLPVTFKVGLNETKSASVKDLREKGGQHLIVLAAPKGELADALFGARVGKTLFAKNNVMIAPFVIQGGNDKAGEEASSVKGFGGMSDKATGMKEAMIDSEAYVAKPAESASWATYIDEELEDAVRQGNEIARKTGIGIVMRKDGSIIRRGLGQPDWKEVVAELTGAKGTSEFGDAYVPPIGAGGGKGGKKKRKKG